MNTLRIFHGAPKPIKLRGCNVVRLVQFAMNNRGWHAHSTDRATLRALSSAVRAGCIEMQEQGLFRFVFPSAAKGAMPK